MSDFKSMLTALRQPDSAYQLPTTTYISYNPRREMIEVIGLQPQFGKAAKRLEALVNKNSRPLSLEHSRGSRDGIPSGPSSPRVVALDYSVTGQDAIRDIERVFPVTPEENRLTVRLWFQCILPELPRILRDPLGGDYTAGLVRRGLSDISAKPHIEIESPSLPGPETQKIVQGSIDEVCKVHHHARIPLRFARGTFRKLNGGGQEDAHDANKRHADGERIKFNFLRPYSKPGMGASIGLLCSRISATLGGYVLIDGIKYMLTSAHFVKNSWKPANLDRNIDDENSNDHTTIMSPSRRDLKYIKDCLIQTKRDLCTQMNHKGKNYEVEDIYEGLTDCNPLGSGIDELVAGSKDIDQLLRQVTKPPSEYAVGSVFKFSKDQRTVGVPSSLADICSLTSCTLNYHMDWTLCEVKRTGENQHKYQSNKHALEDHYVEESQYANQPSEVCHEICEAEVGVKIHYVGQGSQRRSGKVNLPMQISVGSNVTYGWTIISSEGAQIPYEHVEGDSGAWVITETGNKLMGQVHAHSSGKVVFTPINAVFLDLQDLAQDKDSVSLPPRPPGSEQPMAFEARPLSSARSPPPAQSYQFLLDYYIPERSANRTDPDKAHCQLLSKSTNDSPSSLPSLTDSSPSPDTGTDTASSSPSLHMVHQLEDEERMKPLLVESSRSTAARLTDSDIPFLALDALNEQEHDQTVETAFDRNQGASKSPCLLSTHPLGTSTLGMITSR